MKADSPAIWVKLDPTNPNSDEIISHGNIVILEDPRFTVAHNEQTDSYVLAVSYNLYATRYAVVNTNVSELIKVLRYKVYFILIS